MGESTPTPPNTTPSNIYTPFGNITNGGGNGTNSTYSPVQGQGSPYNPGQMQQEQNAIGSLSNQLNQPYNLSQAINNPYTQELYQAQMAPTSLNFQQQQSQLANTMNAKNQLGSSYDALAQNQLGTQYNLAQQGAESNAMTQGIGAYNQQITNTQNALASNENAYNSAFAQTYQPFTQGTQYQSQALNPLVADQTQVYGDQMAQQTALMQMMMGGNSIGVNSSGNPFASIGLP